MGRSYIVEDAVEGYLSKLCEQQAGSITGLLIGQSSTQRDFVVTATRTPQKEESAAAAGNSPDKEWVIEHARQVSRMLPGGLSVLGVFIITDTDSKDTLTTVRQLVFAVENLISSEHLWNPADDDVTDCVTLHVNPKTRKTFCRTFDVKDPKSMAKPADWKYQSGVCSSWSMVSCCINVDMLVPLPDNRTGTESMDTSLKEELKVWAHQLESGVCLIDGKKLAEDTELTGGQKRNVRQTYTAQILITPDDQRLTDVVQRCGGSVSIRGAIHSRAYLHSNKPKVKLAENNLIAEYRMLERKLNDMNNMMNAKEEKLRGRHRDTHFAIQWLRQNRQLFGGNVHEPMMLVINVKDHRFAKFVENHISFHDLRAFVFQRKDDMERFMTEVRDKMNLKVNSISAPVESCSRRPPSRSIEALRRFGFFTYLREMFDAPDEVMSYLCHQYKVHDVPVGNDQTKAMIKTVIEEPYLRVFYTTEERYTLKRSHYSNKISTSNSAVHPSQYLTITVDAEEKRQLEQQMKACELKLQDIEERMKALQTEAASLDRRDNELLAEKKHLSEVKGKKRQLEQKISTKQDSLKQMEQSVIDLQKIEEETKEKIAAVNSQKVSIVTAFMTQMKLRAKLTMEKVYLALETVGLMAEKTKLENDCREGASELKTIDQKCSRLEQRKVQLTEQCKGLLKRAKTICRMQPDESLPEDLRNAFSKLPDTLDEIDTLLNEERARAECFTGLSERVVEEYNKREQEIKHLEKELEDRSNALNAYRQNISEAKERWLNPLKQLVEQINGKFSDFFRSMQCAGEVDLHSENEEEYDKYGIRIRVKFHSSTQLHELTAYHQSGGERSVSTMLYLMALQELNRCPFRVVDEINQGMDPVNERRVFDIVVRTACKETTSQYFFITPKLLQNLQYADEMTVLCVHNGGQMLPPNQWDEKAFIKRCLERKARA